ncbi:Halomucin [Frankliniella fusca]|uniref:Halomucin n=1 Tax=Frankliniella fusca TaxID=407009 RepID=A0AAE1I4E2_9NEOP|nr:Halomucin [Frankliniella fusca]
MANHKVTAKHKRDKLAAKVKAKTARRQSRRDEYNEHQQQVMKKRRLNDVNDEEETKLQLRRNRSHVSKYRQLNDRVHNESDKFCKTCYIHITKGNVPRLALSNGLDFPVVDKTISKLNRIEERLIAARHVFQTLWTVKGPEGQYKTKGGIVNVPVDIDTSVTKLPRQVNDTHMIHVRLARKMEYVKNYMSGIVRPKLLYRAAKILVKKPLLKEEGITLSSSWSNSNFQDNIDDIDMYDEEDEFYSNCNIHETLLTHDSLSFNAVATAGIRFAPAEGSPHAHMLVWLKNAPVFEPDNLQSHENVCNFVDKIISCSSEELSEKLVAMQFHKHSHTCHKRNNVNQCRFNIPYYPMNKTCILLPLSEEHNTKDRKKHEKRQKKIQEHLNDIVKNMSFGEFLISLKITEEEYYLAIRTGLTKPQLFLRRSPKDIFISPFSKKIIELMRSNINIQFVLDAFGAATYVIDYINKSSRGMSMILKQVLQEVREGNENLRKSLTKLSNAFYNNSELSIQEACYNILQIPLSRSSEECIFIPTFPAKDRVRMVKSHRKLEQLDEESTDMFESGLLEHYINRPDSLKDECLAHFAANYRYSSNDGKNAITLKNNTEEFDNIVNVSSSAVHKPQGLAIYIKKKLQKNIKSYSVTVSEHHQGRIQAGILHYNSLINMRTRGVKKNYKQISEGHNLPMESSFDSPEYLDQIEEPAKMNKDEDKQFIQDTNSNENNSENESIDSVENSTTNIDNNNSDTESGTELPQTQTPPETMIPLDQIKQESDSDNEALPNTRKRRSIMNYDSDSPPCKKQSTLIQGCIKPKPSAKQRAALQKNTAKLPQPRKNVKVQAHTPASTPQLNKNQDMSGNTSNASTSKKVKPTHNLPKTSSSKHKLSKPTSNSEKTTHTKKEENTKKKNGSKQAVAPTKTKNKSENNAMKQTVDIDDKQLKKNMKIKKDDKTEKKVTTDDDTSADESEAESKIKNHTTTKKKKLTKKHKKSRETEKDSKISEKPCADKNKKKNKDEPLKQKTLKKKSKKRNSTSSEDTDSTSSSDTSDSSANSNSDTSDSASSSASSKSATSTGSQTSRSSNSSSCVSTESSDQDKKKKKKAKKNKNKKKSKSTSSSSTSDTDNSPKKSKKNKASNNLN